MVELNSRLLQWRSFCFKVWINLFLEVMLQRSKSKWKTMKKEEYF